MNFVIKNRFLRHMATIVISLALFICVNSDLRTKRWLTFPRTSPTRAQIIGGIGVPVELAFESVLIGWVLKAEYWLPENASNFINIWETPFRPTIKPLSGTYPQGWGVVRRNAPNPNENETTGSGYDSVNKEKYELYNEEAIVINDTFGHEGDLDFDMDDDEDNAGLLEDNVYEVEPVKKQSNFAASRWTLYKGLEAIGNSRGLDGRSCVLRSICEAANIPFTYSSGILAEVVHIAMSPSLTNEPVAQHSDNEYRSAEQFGKSGAPCDRIFKDCKTSVLEQFSLIFSTLENIVKVMG